MGLRYYLLCLLAVDALLWESHATFLRPRRQLIDPSGSDLESAYRPPIALISSAPVAAAASATLQNSYQPPISLVRSNEYQSPLMPYPADAPRTYNSHPQTYVLQNAPHQSQSVQYFPSPSGNQQQQPFSAVLQQQQQPFPRSATSYSVQQEQQQQPAQSTSFSHSTTAERTSKVLASHVPSQAIHKAPASEIQSDKGGQAAKEKDKANDEYVVYYYYYYDNDTAPNNLSLNFDDIPSLESYDGEKPVNNKEPEKSASARTLAANVNSLTPVVTETGSQPRSVGDVYGRRPGHEDIAAPVQQQPPKPVSNVFRYGSNEVPRFPVLPNFIVTEVPTTTRADILTPDTLTTEPPRTQSSLANGHQPDLKTGDEADDDDLNSVLDNNASDLKSVDDRVEEDATTTTTTTTTTESPTTTEETTTTTTEKPRRRPSLGGGSRRRFNPSPSSSSFGSNRNRQNSNRSTTSSTSSTSSTTTTSAPPRRSFQGNRIRPRPSAGSNRPRPSSRTTEANEDVRPESAAPSESPASPSSSTTTTASRSRFTSAAPRRFQSSRSRTTSSTSSTTSTTRAPPVSRSRPPSSSSSSSSRPRPNLISRNRPPRPGFLRPRPGSEPEETETTTVAAPATTEQEEAPPETSEDEPASAYHDDDEDNETEEDNETSADEEPVTPTTTEGSRFSALFRPRNRSALGGNRPRPVIGNRPPIRS